MPIIAVIFIWIKNLAPIPLKSLMNCQKELENYLENMVKMQENEKDGAFNQENSLLKLSSEKRHEIRIISWIYWLFGNEVGRGIRGLEDEVSKRNLNLLDNILGDSKEIEEEVFKEESKDRVIMIQN